MNLSSFTNWKRYNKSGQIELDNISENDNFVIKGDNLLVLETLENYYRNKIKLICIDPPYNTGGNNFVYGDNHDSDEWLKFMELRLTFAHKLLSAEGIIYIHCDDRENAYLKILCDNIFGRKNFITNLIWRKKAGGANDSNTIAVEHEYILAYKKNKNGIYKIPLDEKLRKTYKYQDAKVEIYGNYKIKDLDDQSLSDSQGLHYDVECPDGSILEADQHQWKCNNATFLKRLNDNRIIFKKIKNYWKVYYKIYLNEQHGELNRDAENNVIPRGRNLSSILYNVALNKDGAVDIKQLFNGEKPFNYPKPVKLIKTLIESASRQSDIILDFFAGSGTTAQAVLELTKEGSRRQFILVEKEDFIETITIPRIIKSLNLYDLDDTFVSCETNQ